MQRTLICLLTATILNFCATASGRSKPTVVIAGQNCCAKHKTPLISVRGFEAKPGVLVHDADPRSVTCHEHSRNRILDRERLARTHLHPRRAIVTYCPRCEADYTDCLIGHHLSDADVQAIGTVVSHRTKIRKPIIRIVAVDVNRALVTAGHEQHVGDVFDDVGVTKRHGRWHISSSVDAHRIIATGIQK